MQVHRLKHGYHGYKGHILNVPQKACVLYGSIPRKWEELDTVMFVGFDKEGNKKTFRVNKKRVVAACHWLKNHNPDFAQLKVQT